MTYNRVGEEKRGAYDWKFSHLEDVLIDGEIERNEIALAFTSVSGSIKSMCYSLYQPELLYEKHVL